MSILLALRFSIIYQLDVGATYKIKPAIPLHIVPIGVIQQDHHKNILLETFIADILYTSNNCGKCVTNVYETPRTSDSVRKQQAKKWAKISPVKLITTLCEIGSSQILFRVSCMIRNFLARYQLRRAILLLYSSSRFQRSTFGKNLRVGK